MIKIRVEVEKSKTCNCFRSNIFVLYSKKKFEVIGWKIKRNK